MKPIRSLLVWKPAFGNSSELAELKPKRVLSLLFAALALCLCSVPAMASTLFSDLGTGSNVSDGGTFYNVCGSAGGCADGSMTIASPFIVSGDGSQPVTGIDVAVVNVPGSLNTFEAMILADNSGQPGSLIADLGSLATAALLGDSADLVSITGITGVTLTGGQTYFMVLGPSSTTDSSWNGWNYNYQDGNVAAVGGLLVLSSPDGGATWADANGPLPAFDVVGSESDTPDPETPEPGTLLLFGAGLIGMVGIRRRWPNR